jgi:hypothetical protein
VVDLPFKITLEFVGVVVYIRAAVKALAWAFPGVAGA